MHSAPCTDPRLADGHPGENDWSASAQDASKNLINNDFLKNRINYKLPCSPYNLK